MHAHRTFVLLSLLALGCDVAPANVRAVTLVDAAPRPAAGSALVATHSFLPHFGVVTGVAVEPDTGRRLVLLQHGAIWELDRFVSLTEEDFDAVPLFSATSRAPEFGFTDMVALGGDRLAVTALGDGYLVEIEARTQTPHFCYEPGWIEPQGQDPRQLAQAVAYDPSTGEIYAQPQTLENAGFGAPTESFIATYDGAGGQDLVWWVIEDVSFRATGMALESPGVFLVGRGATLYRFHVASGELRPAVDLGAIGVQEVSGIAVDATTDTVLVADNLGSAVYELDRSAL